VWRCATTYVNARSYVLITGAQARAQQAGQVLLLLSNFV